VFEAKKQKINVEKQRENLIEFQKSIMNCIKKNVCLQKYNSWATSQLVDNVDVRVKKFFDV